MATAEIATCIGCGCDDNHACWDNKAGQPCGWLRIDRETGLGVCSACPEHTDRWDLGDTTSAGSITLISNSDFDTTTLKQLVDSAEGMSRDTYDLVHLTLESGREMILLAVTGENLDSVGMILDGVRELRRAI